MNPSTLEHNDNDAVQYCEAVKYRNMAQYTNTEQHPNTTQNRRVLSIHDTDIDRKMKRLLVGCIL